MESRLTLNLEDNDALAELFDGREPGQKIELTSLKGKILDLTNKSVTIAVTDLDHDAIGAVELDDDKDEEPDNEPDESAPIGNSVSSVMKKKGLATK